MQRSKVQGPSVSLFILASIVAFGLVVLDPYLLLLFSPILLGAPHALSDIWYLIAQDSGLPRRARLLIAIFATIVFSAGVLVLFGRHISPQLESLLLVALLAAPLVVVAPLHATFAGWAIVAAVAYTLLVTDFPTRAVVAHLHNMIALTFLFVLALPKWRAIGVFLAALLVTTLCAAGIAVSLYYSGVFLDPIASPAWSPFMSLALGAGPAVSGALLFSYAFLQLMHFVVWIGFIPAFKRDINLAVIRRSLGIRAALFVGLVVACVVIAAPIAALADPLQARQAYLTLVSFHGWMEISWLLAHMSYLSQRGELSFRSAFMFEHLQHA